MHLHKHRVRLALLLAPDTSHMLYKLSQTLHPPMQIREQPPSVQVIRKEGSCQCVALLSRPPGAVVSATHTTAWIPELP
jgi:hypothetical protein